MWLGENGTVAVGWPFPCVNCVIGGEEHLVSAVLDWSWGSFFLSRGEGGARNDWKAWVRGMHAMPLN